MADSVSELAYSARPAAERLVGDGLVRVRDACEMLSLSRSSVYELLSRGEIPSVKLGRSRRIPLKALVAYAAERVSLGT